VENIPQEKMNFKKMLNDERMASNF